MPAPTALAQLEALFARAITWPTGIDDFWRQADADTRAAFDAAFDGTPGFDRRARMTVYADAYFWRLHDVLVDHFGLLAWLLGPAAFRNLATDYVLQRPSTDPDIRRFGARLPEFVAAHPLGHPHLHELVAIEWAMVRALDVVQPPPRTRASLLALAPEAWPSLPLRAVPSVFVGRCHHDFAALWEQHLRAPSPAAPPAAGEPRHVLVWRSGHDVLHRALDDDEAAALARVHQGVAFAALCEHHDAPTAAAWLQRWIDDGLLADTTD